MFPNLFIKNGSILHVVIDEECWTHYLGLDADPVQWKHEWVQLLNRKMNQREMLHTKINNTTE